VLALAAVTLTALTRLGTLDGDSSTILGLISGAAVGALVPMIVLWWGSRRRGDGR
jgi:hypothetical protein